MSLKKNSAKREARVAFIFGQKAIIKDTHVVYASGQHGDTYINKDAIYPYTDQISELCKYIAEDFKNEQIDAVIGPVAGGIILSQWVAHYLSKFFGKEVYALFADKVEDGKNSFTIKRGYDEFIKNGKRILVVEDILTTGESARKVVEVVQQSGGIIVGVAALCNRGGVTKNHVGNVPRLESLMVLSVPTYSETDCPLCRANAPINTKVGKGAEFLKKREKVS